jgi:hypothetical protein
MVDEVEGMVGSRWPLGLRHLVLEGGTLRGSQMKATWSLHGGGVGNWGSPVELGWNIHVEDRRKDVQTESSSGCSRESNPAMERERVERWWKGESRNGIYRQTRRK